MHRHHPGLLGGDHAFASTAAMHQQAILHQSQQRRERQLIGIAAAATLFIQPIQPSRLEGVLEKFQHALSQRQSPHQFLIERFHAKTSG